MMKLIITIPAYNEAKTIGKVIKDIREEMKKHDYDYQLIVMNDGSKDDTVNVAKEAGAEVFSHPRNMGLAETFRSELDKCLELKADVIIHTDADGQYLASDIPKLLKKVEEGYELVLGSRFLGKIESMPLIKKFGNRAFSKVISNITGVKITDGQTGFRAFTSKVAEEIRICSSHTYTQEQIIRAVKHKFRIIEVPVYFAKRGGKTKSRLMKNPFDYAIKASINILRVYRDYEPLKFFGIFGSIFFGLGLLIAIYVLINFLITGFVGALPRVLLSVLLLSIGVQIILFGFIADIFRK